MHPTPTRYEIELEMLERYGALSDHQAIALLHSEFRFAFNAAHFRAVSADDIQVAVLSRAVPQEGVARFAVTLQFDERTPGAGDEHAIALLHSEFQRAFNASYFLRMSNEDFRVRILSRSPAVDTYLTLRAA